MEWTLNIPVVIIGITTSAIVTVLLNRYKKRPRLVFLSNERDEWLRIEVHPLPNDYIRETELGIFSPKILVTNGTQVEEYYYPKYNHTGKLVMSNFRGDEITHWRPMPIAPKYIKG